jgi:hypothetical protein
MSIVIASLTLAQKFPCRAYPESSSLYAGAIARLEIF